MTELFKSSRRRIAHLPDPGAAYAIAQRWTSPGSASRAAESARHLTGATSVVRLHSNKTPHGPSPMALKAMTDAFSFAWRYPDEPAETFLSAFRQVIG